MGKAVDIHMLSAKDVLVDGAVDDYEREMEFFYLQLVPLNVNIYYVERIFAFPFDLFVGLMPVFFGQVVDNFLQVGLLVITKLVTDTHQDFRTLMQFKNWVMKHVRSEYRSPFQRRLKEVRFTSQAQSTLKRAKQLRDGRLAHFKRQFDAEEARLSLSELVALRDEVNSLLDAFSFNVENMMLPPLGLEDINELLDCVARNSRLLNEPERRPRLWTHRQQKLTEQAVQQFNLYRKKFGLPEV